MRDYEDLKEMIVPLVCVALCCCLAYGVFIFALPWGASWGVWLVWIVAILFLYQPVVGIMMIISAVLTLVLYWIACGVYMAVDAIDVAFVRGAYESIDLATPGEKKSRGMMIGDIIYDDSKGLKKNIEELRKREE